MIENERQYNITRAQLRRFTEALARAEARPAGEVHPRLRVAEIAGLRSQLEDLRKEVADYEGLRSGAGSMLQLSDLGDLGEALIKARVASGLNQRELAQRLGLKEQQIQRYEATRYASASLTRVLEVARALGLSLRAPASLLVSDGAGGYRLGQHRPSLRVADAPGQ